MNPADPERDRGPAIDIATLDALAAEYVLGSLESESRVLFERLLWRDEAVRALVVGWEARLQGLADALPRQAPPEGFRSRVIEAVRRADEASREDEASVRRPRVPDDAAPGPIPTLTVRQASPGPSPDPVDRPERTEPAAPSPAPTSAPRSDRTRTVVHERTDAANDSGWRAGAIAASVIAASLLALLAGQLASVPDRGTDLPDVALVEPGPASPARSGPPTALSVLSDDDGRPRYLVAIDETDSSVRITALDAEPVASEASLQLWMADGASGELRAVGLLPTDPWSSLRLERVPLAATEPAFAVSVEPPGGSPKAGPTGEVVFQGVIHPLGDAG